MGVLCIDSKDNAHARTVFDLCQFSWKILATIRRTKPDVVLSFTLKGNLAAALLAGLFRIPVITNITGLGSVYLRGKLWRLALRVVYKLSLNYVDIIFFQNSEDRKVFSDWGIGVPGKYKLIPGSGVDIKKFEYSPKVSNTSSFRFLMISRLIKDKGVVEYIAAATNLKRQNPTFQFLIVGDPAQKNPNAVSNKIVSEAVNRGIITHIAFSADITHLIKESDCVVLPSYREGMPKSLLEASAIGRPLIATDVAGCNELIDHEKNGLLCKPKSAEDLTLAMQAMASFSSRKKMAMAAAARLKVEEKFSDILVSRHYLTAIKELLR